MKTVKDALAHAAGRGYPLSAGTVRKILRTSGARMERVRMANGAVRHEWDDSCLAAVDGYIRGRLEPRPPSPRRCGVCGKPLDGDSARYCSGCHAAMAVRRYCTRPSGVLDRERISALRGAADALLNDAAHVCACACAGVLSGHSAEH